MTLRVFIYGSCVTRDAVEHWDPEQVEMAGYIARQSLVSAMSPAGDAEEFRLSRIESSFQRRMLRGDVESSLLPTLIEQADQYDVILWDLTDERNGVQELPGGGWVTRLRNFDKEQLYRGELGAICSPGTSEFNVAWNHALDRFLTKLSDAGLIDRLILNDTPWATKDDNGEQFTENERTLHSHLHRLSRAVRAAGIPAISPDSAATIASTNHKWDRAPFHYVDDTYRSMTAELLAATAASHPSTPH